MIRVFASPLAAALAAMVALAASAQASAAATFTCHASPMGRCYFSVLHASGARTDFQLPRGQSRILDDATPGVDRYMVSVNFAPPFDPATCSRVVRPGARRSWWCKLGPVKTEGND